MLAEIAGAMSRKSSPSVIAFASDYELLLGKRRICSDGDQGEQIKRNASRVVLFALRRCRRSTQSLLVLKAVAAATPGNALSSSLRRATSSPFFSAGRWLPEEIIVLADREFVDRLGVTYAALAFASGPSRDGRIGSRLARRR